MGSIWLTLPFYALFAGALALFLLSVRALLVERREGRPQSKLRVVAMGAIAIMVGLTLVGQHFLGGRTRQIVPVEEDVLSTKKRQLEQLEAELEALKAEIAAIERGERPAVEEPPAAEPTLVPGDLFWLTMAGSLVMIGVVLLFLLGDLHTVIPRRKKPIEELESLAHAVDEGEYEKAIELGKQIREERVPELDRIDLFFLRAYAAVQLAGKASGNERKSQLEGAEKDLNSLLAIAPDSGPALYLFGLARGLAGEHQVALGAFRSAKDKLKDPKLPLATQESVCLLALAEQSLAANQPDQANTYFEQATRLGVLKDRIPVVLVENRLLNVRKSVSEGDLAKAEAGIELLRGVAGLAPDQQEAVRVICDAFTIMIHHRGGRQQETLDDLRAFLARVSPELPPVNEQTAEEYLEAAVDVEKLTLPVELFRALHFLEAAVALRIALADRGELPAAAFDAITTSLYRALQFQPRHREVLAALGVLHHLFGPRDRVPKSREWMESAVSMGTRSRIVRRLLEKDRLLQEERHELLERFRSVSSRFLTDPAVSALVRRALVAELGRFRDFQPMLVELEAEPEAPPQSPTLRHLRERARHLDALVGDMARRGREASSPANREASSPANREASSPANREASSPANREASSPANREASSPANREGESLSSIHTEYGQLLASLEQVSGRLTELDAKVMIEVGKIVFGEMR